MQVVAPKQQSLDAAESELGEQMGRLRIKQAELQDVTDKLQKLNDDLENKQTEKQASMTDQTLAVLIIFFFNWEKKYF